jgi:hypothetical protein
MVRVTLPTNEVPRSWNEDDPRIEAAKLDTNQPSSLPLISALIMPLATASQ